MEGKCFVITIQTYMCQVLSLIHILITLAQGRQNELEFFSTLLLQQKIFHPEDLFVVGVASGYEEALELIEEITDDVYQKTKDAKIREYITQEQDAYKAGKR